MTKIQLKSDKVKPFGGIFSIMETFSNILEPTINLSLGQRCASFGYQYGEIGHWPAFISAAAHA